MPLGIQSHAGEMLYHSRLNMIDTYPVISAMNRYVLLTKTIQEFIVKFRLYLWPTMLDTGFQFLQPLERPGFTRGKRLSDRAQYLIARPIHDFTFRLCHCLMKERRAGVGKSRLPVPPPAPGSHASAPRRLPSICISLKGNAITP